MDDYRFTNIDQEPTDEQLSQLMREVAEDAKERYEKAHAAVPARHPPLVWLSSMSGQSNVSILTPMRLRKPSSETGMIPMPCANPSSIAKNGVNNYLESTKILSLRPFFPRMAK